MGVCGPEPVVGIGSSRKRSVEGSNTAMRLVFISVNQTRPPASTMMPWGPELALEGDQNQERAEQANEAGSMQGLASAFIIATGVLSRDQTGTTPPYLAARGEEDARRFMVANLFRFMPHEEHFFDLLNRSASTVSAGANALLDFMENYIDVERKARKLKDIEHMADEITHEICGALNRTFITPLDREDIGTLAEALDDVLDWTEEVSRRMYIYKVAEPTALARRFAHVIAEQGLLIEKMVPLLVNEKGRAAIEQSKQEINRLENDDDDIL